MICCGLLYFFFQAEDGIRDLYVTGVQTCALPISATVAHSKPGPSGQEPNGSAAEAGAAAMPAPARAPNAPATASPLRARPDMSDTLAARRAPVAGSGFVRARERSAQSVHQSLITSPSRSWRGPIAR